MTEDAHTYRAVPDRAFADRLEGELLRRLEARDTVGSVLLLDLDPLDEGRRDVARIDPAAEPPPEPRTSPRWLLAGVAAAVILIAAIVLAGGTTDHGRGTASVGPVPSSITPRPGYPLAPGLHADLGPADAPPSAPETGELVASVGRIGRGVWFLYADGRLISTSLATDSPGFVEQRLTPAGIERVRSEFLSTGLFDPDKPTSEVSTAAQVPALCGTVWNGGLCVRDHGRLLSAQLYTPLRSGTEVVEFETQLGRLIDSLEQLDSSLPQDLWVDRRTKPYRPGKYGVCISRTGSDSTLKALSHPSELVALLPPTAAELLRGRATTGGFEWLGDATCFVVTPDEARSLVDDFDSAGWTIGVTGPVSMTVGVTIWELLPHGMPQAMSEG